MAAAWGWPLGTLWAAVEACPPYRLIGLYPSRYTAAERAIEFGAPAEVHAIASALQAQDLVQQVRQRREGR